METEVKIEISQEQFVRFSEQTDFLKVSKEDIIKVANSVTINTVYFLRDFEK